MVAKHDRARDLDDFSSYASDPVAFVREVLQEREPGPWQRQVEIAEAVRDHPLVVVRSANAVGKDWIAARLALWWALARRGLALVTGPTERQVREVVMGEVARAFRKAEGLPGELFQMALRLGDEEHAGILAFTSTEASRLTGFHAPRVMAVLTEAQGVEDFAFEGLLSCATGGEDRVLAVGNPLAPSGRFYSASSSGAWRSIRIPVHDHPNLRQGREVIPGGPSEAFVRRIAEEYGESSGIYQARVEGEFPDASEEGLLARSWLTESFERWAGAGEGEPVVAVDPARFGPDLTAVAVARGSVVTEIVTWGGRTETTEVVERVRGVLERVGVRPEPGPDSRGRRLARLGLRPGEPEGQKGSVVVDSVGLGAGVADQLRGEGYHVREFNGGERARQPERFMNRRAESYWRLRELLERGEVALPPDEELAEELLALQWRPTPGGQVRLEAKTELKGRLGRSPDRSDAVVMALSSRAAVASLLWGSR